MPYIRRGEPLEQYISYMEIAKQLDIPSGTVLYLSSELIQLALVSKKNGEKFDADVLIDSFLKTLGEAGTLCIPTFNFDFTNHGFYDYKASKSTTGALGNYALKHDGFQRTRHPVHSFAVAGKRREQYCSLENSNSFGVDSIFQKFYEHNAIQVILGADYQKAMTFIHYVEMMEGVFYRYIKKFRGKYVDEYGIEKEKQIDYYARDLQINPIEKFNRIGKILEEKQVSTRYVLDGISIYKINLHKSYEIVADDIRNNGCKNLYDFAE